MHFFASYCQPPVSDHKFYDLFMFYTGMMNSLTQKEVWVPNIPEWKIFFLKNLHFHVHDPYSYQTTAAQSVFFNLSSHWSSLYPTRAFKARGFYNLHFCMIGRKDRRHFCWSIRNEPWSQEAIANINPIIDEDHVPVFRARIIQVRKLSHMFQRHPFKMRSWGFVSTIFLNILKVVRQ